MPLPLSDKALAHAEAELTQLRKHGDRLEHQLRGQHMTGVHAARPGNSRWTRADLDLPDASRGGHVSCIFI